MDNKLKAWRVAKGLRPEVVASAAEISLQTLWNYEAGRFCPNLITARRLAAVLETTVDELFPWQLALDRFTN